MDRRTQEELLRAWLRDHTGILLKVVRAFAREPADQDDLFQEIVTRLWIGMPSFDGRSAAATWIYRVALNHAMCWQRSETRERQRRERWWHESAVPPDDADLLECLYDAIHELSPMDRSLILLQLDGYSYRDIAETFGLSESNVGVRLHRCRQLLADQLRGDER